jgi:Domain of unknown function (DUF5753)
VAGGLSLLLGYVGYEAGASSIRQFPGPVVPGLLQTTGYAEALTTSAVEAIEVAPVVKLRMQRQAELARRSHPPRQQYVLDEAVIRRHIGIDSDPESCRTSFDSSPTPPPGMSSSASG